MHPNLPSWLKADLRDGMNPNMIKRIACERCDEENDQEDIIACGGCTEELCNNCFSGIWDEEFGGYLCDCGDQRLEEEFDE